MFSEILRIIPSIDTSQLANMERTLSSRFSTVTRKFGHGLKSAVKGSILGLSLGLIAKLLAPLTDVEDRIKALLGKGGDARDLADKFNTSEGNILRMQAVGASLGLKPEELTKMMDKFQGSIEKAQIEMATPGATLSPDAVAVSRFTGEKDIAKSFMAFIQALREAPTQQRQNAERDVFGGKLYGPERRFVDSQLSAQAAKAGIPSQAAFDKSGKNAANLAEMSDMLQAGNDARNFVGQAGLLNANMVKSLEASRQKEEAKLKRELEQYEMMKKGSLAIEKVGDFIDLIRENLVRAVGWIVTVLTPFMEKTFIPFINKISDMSIFRMIRGGR